MVSDVIQILDSPRTSSNMFEKLKEIMFRKLKYENNDSLKENTYNEIEVVKQNQNLEFKSMITEIKNLLKSIADLSW